MGIAYKSADQNWITGEDPIFPGGGGGKWSTDEHASPDQQAKLLFALSNGEIEGPLHPTAGLRDVYLNDVPVMNPDGSKNFNGISVALTSGTLTQAPIPGFADVEALTSSGNLISNASPQSFSISNSGPTAARVNLSIPAIYQQGTDGKMSSDTVTLTFEVSNNGGGYVDVTSTVDPVLLGTITAQSTGAITRSYRIPLTTVGTGPWVVRVSRVTVDNNGTYRDNRVYLQSWAAITEQQLRYPRTSLLAFSCDAKRFSSMPKVSIKVRGIKVQVPANYTPATRDPDTGVWTAATYATTGPGTTGGSWDGTFKASWTSNPAWILYDLAT
ncbi:MAG TPA: hypothetical protein VK150_04930, partial [Geothrix sp.]|nr:hypothetical protein [Geothrix sp.]